MRRTTLLVMTVVLAGVTTAGAAGPQPKTDDEKTLYAIGVSVGRNLRQFDLSPAETDLVKAGIADGLANKKPRVDVESINLKAKDLLQARVAKTAAAEKQKAQAFLDKAAAEPGAQRKPSGLIYTEIRAGDGAQPKSSDTVKVNYTGKLRDGTVFDSGTGREFPVHGVIPCWQEGLQVMKEHGKAKLVCPSDLAYGDRWAKPNIKPGSALAFEVELLEVVPSNLGVPAAGDTPAVAPTAESTPTLESTPALH